MSRRFGLAWIACSAIICAAGTGCCCKKGFVVRGDWSLELNRIPFMSSNGPQYDATCTEYGCSEPCSCTDGCTVEGCTSGCACGAHAGGAGHAYGSGHAFGPGGGSGVHGGYGPHGGAIEEGHSAMPLPPSPTAAAPTRFHPVPTRPVFEATPEPYAAPQGAWTTAGAKPAAQR